MQKKDKNDNSYKISFFVILFLVFCSAILGDSTAEALLLSSYPAKIVPLMYIVNAFFLFLASLSLMTAIDKVNRGEFFHKFLLIHSGILFLVWLSVYFKVSFLFIPLFSYSYISKIFLFLLFWTLANDIVDSRRAGSDFPFIAAGGTVGAIGVSFSIPWLMKVISASSLLFIWASIVFFLSFCFIPVKKRYQRNFIPSISPGKRERTSFVSMKDDIKSVFNEPLLRVMSTLYFLLFFILLNQHYSFYSAIKIRFVDASKLASFLGYFNGISMGGTFLIQASVAGWFLKRIGSTRSMLFLPITFAIIFAVILYQMITINLSDSVNVALYGTTDLYLFITLVAGVGIRIAIFDSLFSPNFQIFFSSLPQEYRGKGKLVIEGIVKPAAMISASCWIFFVTPNISMVMNTSVLFFASLLMIIQTVRLRSKYTESLTNHLGSFHTVMSSAREVENDQIAPKDLPNIIKLFKTEDDEIRKLLITWIVKSDSKDGIDFLIGYYRHATGAVRADIILSLIGNENAKVLSMFKEGLTDRVPIVVSNAMTALVAYEDSDIDEGLEAYLYSRNPMIKARACSVLWNNSSKQKRKFLKKVLEKMIFSEDPFDVSYALFAMQSVDVSKEITELFEKFMRTKEELYTCNRNVWKEFIALAGCNVSKVAPSVLLSLSGILSNRRRNDVTHAISSACEKGYDITELFGVLEGGEPIHRSIILDILLSGKELFKSATIEILPKIAQNEYVAAINEIEKISVLKYNSDKSAIELLVSAIKEEIIDSHIKNIVKISAILDSTGRIATVMHRVNHENAHVRARAIEVFDNTGVIKINRLVISLIDRKSNTLIINEAERKNIETETIAKYLTNSNFWIRQCAEYAAMTY